MKITILKTSCCWYHKGTNFQANHNWWYFKASFKLLLLIPQRYEFSSKSQPPIFNMHSKIGCCWYHKGTNFQANHNKGSLEKNKSSVVADTTKVRIFKQITTHFINAKSCIWLLLIPQRYEFSSKSQLAVSMEKIPNGCCWYHKGTNFQANHNY